VSDDLPDFEKANMQLVRNHFHYALTDRLADNTHSTVISGETKEFYVNVKFTKGSRECRYSISSNA